MVGSNHQPGRGVLIQAAWLALIPIWLAGAASPRATAGAETPATRIWFVDNSAKPGGDGSRKAPLALLASAERVSAPGDTIYILVGDGTSRGQDQGIRLKEGQSLLGQGVELRVGGRIVVEPGDYPVLSGSSDGAGLTLADRNVVAGLAISGAGGPCVEGVDIEDARIGPLIVEGCRSDGLSFERTRGDVALADVVVRNPGGHGVSVRRSRGSLRLAGGEIVFGEPTDGTGILIVDADRVELTGGGSGRSLVVRGAGTGTGAAGHGIHLSGAGDVVIESVLVEDVGESEVGDLEAGLLLEGIWSTLEVTGSTVRRVHGGAAIAVLRPEPDRHVRIRVAESTLAGNGSDFTTTETGVRLEYSGGPQGRLEATISDNRIVGVREGVAVEIGDAPGRSPEAVHRVEIRDNTIVDLDNDALDLTVGGTSISRFVIASNTLEGTDRLSRGDPDVGVSFQLGGEASRARARVEIVGNPRISGFGEQGVRVRTFGRDTRGEIDLLIAENDRIEGCGKEGVRIEADDSASILAEIRDNTLIGNGGAAGFSAGFRKNDAATLRVALKDNESDTGFELETDRKGAGRLELASSCGRAGGDPGDCLAADGNTSRRRPAVVLVTGSPDSRLVFVDPRN